ncbi:potassium channel family protein [Shewanella sp. MEBiC00475]|uniref:potassium channel family protein n=1 Tax=Shewanella sp. MEBiC00475 TaxID=2575361 RepID=UPI001586BD28|nr:potassium channel family protein [Shewanella sp. MEBiC00475]
MLHFKPLTYGIIYFSYIPAFAILYCISPCLIKDLSIIDSLYFSVVTLTTLGYGDILPISSLGKIIVSLQTILGVVTVGLFLNSLAELRAKLEFQRLAENSVNILERHVCLLLEQLKNARLMAWDKHAINAESYDQLREFIDNVYLGVLNGQYKLNGAQIILFLQTVDQQHDTIVGLIPIATNVSSDIGMQWISLVSNVRNLTQQYKAYASADPDAFSPPTQNDVALQIEELINSFYIICDKKRPIKKIKQDT